MNLPKVWDGVLIVDASGGEFHPKRPGCSMKYSIYWRKPSDAPVKLATIEAHGATKAREIFWIDHALVIKEGD